MQDLMSADSPLTDDSLTFEIKNHDVKKLELHRLCESSPVEMIHIICEFPILLKKIHESSRLLILQVTQSVWRMSVNFFL